MATATFLALMRHSFPYQHPHVWCKPDITDPDAHRRVLNTPHGLAVLVRVRSRTNLARTAVMEQARSLELI
jgi:hypothetical protein